MSSLTKVVQRWLFAQTPKCTHALVHVFVRNRYYLLMMTKRIRVVGLYTEPVDVSVSSTLWPPCPEANLLGVLASLTSEGDPIILARAPRLACVDDVRAAVGITLQPDLIRRTPVAQLAALVPLAVGLQTPMTFLAGTWLPWSPICVQTAPYDLPGDPSAVCGTTTPTRWTPSFGVTCFSGSIKGANLCRHGMTTSAAKPRHRPAHLFRTSRL